MSISIIIPAYKEAENLKVLLPQFQNILINQNFEILIIDSIKKLDNTKEIVKQYNFAHYFNRENGNNYGDAIRTGIKYASMEYIVIMDADCSHPPNLINKFIEEINNGYDLVIASRYIDGANSHKEFSLTLMSLILNKVYSFFLRLNIKDISNSYRMYKSYMLKSIDLTFDNFDILQEILIKLMKKYNLKIKEIPINFQHRKFGESKRKLFKFIYSYLFNLVKLYKNTDQTRPDQTIIKYADLDFLYYTIILTHFFIFGKRRYYV